MRSPSTWRARLTRKTVDTKHAFKLAIAAELRRTPTALRQQPTVLTHQSTSPSLLGARCHPFFRPPHRDLDDIRRYKIYPLHIQLGYQLIERVGSLLPLFSSTTTTDHPDSTVNLLARRRDGVLPRPRRRPPRRPLAFTGPALPLFHQIFDTDIPHLDSTCEEAMRLAVASRSVPAFSASVKRRENPEI